MARPRATIPAAPRLFNLQPLRVGMGSPATAFARRNNSLLFGSPTRVGPSTLLDPLPNGVYGMDGGAPPTGPSGLAAGPAPSGVDENGLPVPPATVSANLLPAPEMSFGVRAASALAGLPAMNPLPFESAGSSAGRGLLSGLASGYAGSRLARFQNEAGAISEENKRRQTAADLANLRAEKSWEARLKMTADQMGNWEITPKMGTDYPELASIVGMKAPPAQVMQAIGRAQEAAAKEKENAPTKMDSDAALLDGLVKAGTITKAQAEYLKSEGMTKQERRTLATGRSPSMGGAVTLTPEATDFWARAAASGIPLPSLGMGSAGAPARSAILNRAPVVAGGSDLASNKASLQANQQSLKTIQGNLDAVTAFERTALENLKPFESALGKVSDTGIPWANGITRLVQNKLLGSADMAQFNTALEVVKPEFARILTNPTLSGVALTDAARKDMQSVLDNTATAPQMRRALLVLRQDAENRRTSYQKQLDIISSRIKGMLPSGESGQAEEWTRDASGRLVRAK